MLFVDNDRHDGKIPPLKPSAPQEMAARVVLASNQASMGKITTRFGRLETGVAQAVEDGKIVIGLDTGITAILSPLTRYSVSALSKDLIEIRVDKGTIFADVRRQGGGPPFAVTTPFGKVVVTGTAFQVSVSETDCEVEVYRGSVRFESSWTPAREVVFGQVANARSPGVRDMEEDRMAKANDAFRLIDLVSFDDAATIEILSSPSGAEVFLDDEKLGTQRNYRQHDSVLHFSAGF